MTYLSGGIQGRLQQAFSKNNMTLNVSSDCIIAEGSNACSKEKIQGIIESAGFCPLMSESKIDRNFVFTVVPCDCSLA